MLLMKDYPEAYQNKCPYCGANPNEPCKVVQAHNVSTIDRLCFDDFGRPTIHVKRVKRE